MNTQGIRGNTDNWSQFVKLTQQARSRNEGLTDAGVTKTSKNQGTQFSSAIQALRQQSAATNSRSVAGVGETNGFANGMSNKILGGKFDAYA